MQEKTDLPNFHQKYLLKIMFQKHQTTLTQGLNKKLLAGVLSNRELLTCNFHQYQA